MRERENERDRGSDDVLGGVGAGKGMNKNLRSFTYGAVRSF